MMFSPTKTEDMKFLARLYEELERAITNGRTQYAKDTGQTILLMKEKIKTKDYTEDDAAHARLAELDRRRMALRGGERPPITQPI